MSNTPNIHLVIPHLLSPLALWKRDFGFEPQSQYLLPFINNSVAQAVPVQGLEKTLLYISGYPDAENLPWAAIRYAFDTGVPPESVTEALLCADPVYLESHLEGVNLKQVLKATPEEANALLDTLNTHLAQDNLQLITTRSEHWYLKALSETIDFPKTSPASQALGQNIRDYLPQSTNLYWRRLINELQMLLYTHPINQQRERLKQVPINSVWLWGEGLVQYSAPSLGLVQSGDILGQIMAFYNGCARQPELGPSDALNQLLLVQQLTAFALKDDPESWQKALLQLEQQLAWLWEKTQNSAYQIMLYDTLGTCWILPPRQVERSFRQKLASFWTQKH